MAAIGIILPADPTEKMFLKSSDQWGEYSVMVAGDLEHVSIPGDDRLGLYVNETGKLQGLRPNQRATTLLRLGYAPARM